MDTRDNEYFPMRGHFHQLGLKFVEGIPFSADVRYGQDSTVLVWFIPVHDRIVFATRALIDLQFGNALLMLSDHHAGSDVAEVARNIGRLDSELLRSAMVPVSTTLADDMRRKKSTCPIGLVREMRPSGCGPR